MQAFLFKCDCGNIHGEAQLKKKTSEYPVRFCDCDFCVAREAGYISDPEGSLSFSIRDKSQVDFVRQGSGQAEFIVCRPCDRLMGVIFRKDDLIFGALEVGGVSAGIFGSAVTVSPKTLAPDQKTSRWQDVWFPHVRLGARS